MTGDKLDQEKKSLDEVNEAEEPSSSVPANPLPEGDLETDAASLEEQPVAQQPQEEEVPKKWYVVHTYSGFENKARLSLLENIKRMGLDKYFGEILVPTEQVVESVNKKKRTSSRKFFPSYMLVEMNLNKFSWHCVKDTPKITGFVGNSTQPPAVPEREIMAIKSQVTEGYQKPKPKISFSEGETVRVVDGPFANFSGVVEEVKPDKGRVIVSVSVFQRATPIELEFTQVEKE